jgi:hypothetical protein
VKWYQQEQQPAGMRQQARDRFHPFANHERDHHRNAQREGDAG